MSVKSFFKTLADTAAKMLFPENITCLACGGELDGTDQSGLCGNCKLEFNKIFCRRCGRKIGNMAEFCEACVAQGTYGFETARSSVVYNDTAKKLVYAFKYGNAKYLAGPLAGYMAETAKENGFAAADVLTFVPLHKKRRRKRGYNQSELLANALGKELGTPVVCLLEKTKHTKNLAKLDRVGRVKMIKDTFRPVAEFSLKGKTVLLVDDVFTTGATADECAKVLIKAGAAQVRVLTFASVQMKPGL